MRNIIVFLAISVSFSKLYDAFLPNIMDIKLQNSQSITLLPFPGVLTDKLIIDKNTQNTDQASRLCTIRNGRMKTSVNSVTMFSENNQTSKIISSLQQLKNLKNAIDLAHWKDKFYVIFKNGHVEVYKQLNHSNMSLVDTLKHSNSVSEGYFITIGGIMLYASPTELLRINQTSITPISNYQSNPNFMYPYFYPDNSLFIALNSKGIYKYTFNSKQNTLSKKTYLQLPKTDNIIEIEDFGYDITRSLVMILDFVKGVYFFNIKNDTLVIDTRYTVDIQGCENMEYKDHMLYLTCPDLVLYNLNTFELDRRPAEIYPQDLIITQDKEIILKGSSHIAFFKRWQSRPMIEELIEPNRLIYRAGNLVYINQHQLIQQSMRVFPDAVVCSSDSIDPGFYQVSVSSLGLCNKNYSQGTVDDTCNYKRVIDIEVLGQHNINWKIIVVGCVVLGVAFMSCCAWCVVKNVKLKRSYDILVEDIEGDQGGSSRRNQSVSENFEEKSGSGFSNPKSQNLSDL